MTNSIARPSQDLYVTLFLEDSENQGEEDSSAATTDNNNNAATPAKKREKEQLDALLSKTTEKNRVPDTSPKEILKLMKKELSMLESTGECPWGPEKIYKSFCCLQSSSIYVEGTLSYTGMIVSKCRSSLDDDTVDFMHFLHLFLMQK